MKNYLQEYKTNPFTGQEFINKMNAFAKAKQKTTDTKANHNENGTIKDYTTQGQKTYYDSEEFTKLFIRHAEILTELSKPSLRIMIYIIKNIEKEIDTITLTGVKIKELLSMTDHTYHLAIRNLYEKKIIARTTEGKNKYYINPNILWNGRREALVNNFQLNAIKPKQRKLSKAA